MNIIFILLKLANTYSRTSLICKLIVASGLANANAVIGAQGILISLLQNSSVPFLLAMHPDNRWDGILGKVYIPVHPDPVQNWIGLNLFQTVILI